VAVQQGQSIHPAHAKAAATALPEEFGKVEEALEEL